MALPQDEFLEQLQEINAYEFEQFVADLWELQDWDTYVTKGADDGGIDVVAEQSTPFPKKQVIQVKRYEPSNPVGRPDIQQYASIRQERTDVDTVVVVTTSRFTDGAEEVAKKLNVKLVDGPQLYNLIKALYEFELARSYLDPERTRDGTTSTDAEDGATDTPLAKTETVDDSRSITEFDEDTQLENVPKILPSLITLRREITDDLQGIQSKLDSAEEAYQAERYFDAVEKYEEVNRRRIELRREVARYDAGLTHTDSDTIDHLPATETYTTQLAQITERVDEHFQEAFRIAERAKGLEQLVVEIGERVGDLETRIHEGDQMRHRGDVETAHSKYERAQDGLEAVRETLEIYQGLVDMYDDAITENHQGLPPEFSLSELERKISSKIDSKTEHLNVHKIVEDAAGSFDASLLTGNSGGLFDKELIEYLEGDEQLEFVFQPPRRGFTTVSPDGMKETPYNDTSQSGSCFLVITDLRVLYLVGVDDHDETRSFSYDQLSDVTASTETTIPYLQFTSVDGTEYKFAGIRRRTSQLEPAASYVDDYLA